MEASQIASQQVTKLSEQHFSFCPGASWLNELLVGWECGCKTIGSCKWLYCARSDSAGATLTEHKQWNYISVLKTIDNLNAKFSK